MENKLYVVCLVYPSSIPGDVKIGVSSNPEQRLRTLQTGSSKLLSMEELIGDLPKNTAYSIERTLHEVFANIRKSGEWFDNILLNILASIQRGSTDIDLESLKYANISINDYTKAKIELLKSY